MKKSMLVVLVVLLLALFSLPGNVQADPVDIRAFVLSNELGSELEGGLIDQLIAAGHGSDNLYQVLQLLAAQPGSNIPADFVTAVGSNPAGSEVFTAPLNNFTGLNGPVGINADGTIIICPIFGRDYDGHAGYVTGNATIAGVARISYTLASNASYFIDTGSSSVFVPGQNYLAIGIAWAPTIQGVPEPSSVLLLTIGLACLAGNARCSRE
jgi:hypothetical protein